MNDVFKPKTFGECNFSEQLFSSYAMEELPDKKWYIIKIILSAIICAMALMSNSQEGVIGSMLISPMAAPIIGMIGALFTFQTDNLLRSFGFLLLGIGLMFSIGYGAGRLQPATQETAEMKKRYGKPTWGTFITAFTAGLVFAIGGVTADKGYGMGISEIIGVGICITLLPAFVNAGVTHGLDEVPDKRQKVKESLILGTINVAGILAACLVVYGLNCNLNLL